MIFLWQKCKLKLEKRISIRILGILPIIMTYWTLESFKNKSKSMDQIWEGRESAINLAANQIYNSNSIKKTKGQINCALIKLNHKESNWP